MLTKKTVLQEKAAGTAIDGGKPFNSAVAKCTPDSIQLEANEDVKQPSIDDENVPPAPQALMKQMPNFSGLQNCTFNFYSA